MTKIIIKTVDSSEEEKCLNLLSEDTNLRIKTETIPYSFGKGGPFTKITITKKNNNGFSEDELDMIEKKVKHNNDEGFSGCFGFMIAIVLAIVFALGFSFFLSLLLGSGFSPR